MAAVPKVPPHKFKNKTTLFELHKLCSNKLSEKTTNDLLID
jgi:hypothetical protein